MDFIRVFLMMSKWARRPPSREQKIGIALAIALVVVVTSLVAFDMWPDWATLERRPRFPQ